MQIRKIVVTGASKGIGSAIADRCSHEGWTVVRPGRDELDLADPRSVEAFCVSMEGTEIDALVNNAGENVIGDLETLPEHDLRRMFEVNFFSCWTLTRRLAQDMAKRSRGKILNISSIYGIRARRGRGAYSSTKAALLALTRAAAVEFGPSNVLVNALAPGFIDTELTRKNNTPAQIADLCAQVPLGRLGKPSEIAALAYWLISDQNTFVTGQTIPIDGGFTVQ